MHDERSFLQPDRAPSVLLQDEKDSQVYFLDARVWRSVSKSFVRIASILASQQLDVPLSLHASLYLLPSTFSFTSLPSLLQ
jgi:hypothetical protein